MKNNNSFGSTLLLVLFLAFTLASCVSPGPQTQFYTLLASQSKANITLNKHLADLSVGIGPIVLPEYIQKSAIVSFAPNNSVRIAGYHAWAGDLEANIIRVLVADVGGALNSSNVRGFPWDIRLRPTYQLRLTFLEFGGVRAEQVNITVQWSLIDTRNKKLIQSGTEQSLAALTNDSMSDYVQGLNKALNQIAFSVSEKIAQQIK